MGRITELSAKRLPGYTILEVMASTVIVLVVFGIGLSIYLNITASSGSIPALAAKQLLQSQANLAASKQLFHNRTSEVDGIVIEQKSSTYRQTPGAILLTYKATDKQGKVLATHNQIIRQYNE